MTNVLVISGHPNLKRSYANITILDELQKLIPNVEIRKLDELYPDYKFDIEAEQSALLKADVIVFQFPTYWYSCPGIMKLYIDLIYAHGWAYGSKGKNLVGKTLIASTTTGGKIEAYGRDAIVKHSMDDFCAYLEQFAALCNMNYGKVFCSYSMRYIPGVFPDEKKQDVIDRAKIQAQDLVKYIETL